MNKSAKLDEITHGKHRRSGFKQYVAQVLLAGMGAILMTHGPLAMANTPSQKTNGIPAKGLVTFEGTGFNVMNVQLVRGSSLHFSNPGNSPLDIRIVTWRGHPVKKLSIPAGGQTAWTPKRYGVYVYFDAKTTSFGSVTIKGSDGEKVYQPVALKGAKSYPAPVYGVVAVTNAAGGGITLSSHYGSMEVANSTLTGKHHRAFMNHAPWMEIPGGTMTFKPWVLVVKAGQPVRIYDEDSMNHTFFPGDYPVMYDDHGAIRSYRYPFEGFHLMMNGGHHTITFHHVGIHHVVCLIHTLAWDHTYKSYHMYGGYPYVMDAVVVVEPKGNT